jgi:S-adenosylmethionine uptake transporter
MLSALAYLQVREMGLQGEPEYRVVFYFSATCAVAGLLGSLAGGGPAAGGVALPVASGSKGLLLLLVIGLTAASAQIAMTRAYRLGNTLVVANLQYVGIVFSSVWDVLVWGHALDGTSLFAISVILGSGVLATFHNARRGKEAGQGSEVQAADPIAAEQP